MAENALPNDPPAPKWRPPGWGEVNRSPSGNHAPPNEADERLKRNLAARVDAATLKTLTEGLNYDQQTRARCLAVVIRLLPDENLPDDLIKIADWIYGPTDADKGTPDVPEPEFEVRNRTRPCTTSADPENGYVPDFDVSVQTPTSMSEDVEWQVRQAVEAIRTARADGRI